MKVANEHEKHLNILRRQRTILTLDIFSGKSIRRPVNQ